jgi:flagellar assembly protein FliH
MSSSPSRALASQPAEAAREFQPFPYDSVPPASQKQHILFESPASSDDTAAYEQQWLARGRQEGQAESRKLFEQQLAKERSNLTAALLQFAGDRAAYFRKVECEVVQLSLAIARKILHREAQLDPLLLAGIVRVALEQIDGATRVALRVHPQNASDWQRYLGTQLNPANLPEIVEDAAQPPDQCTLETSMGVTTIGLQVQLKEIERGLMDLLAARPGATP